MSRKNKIILQVITVAMIIVMLLFMGSSLKPYLALFIAVVMSVLLIFWSKYPKNKFLLTTLIIVLFTSVLFVIFPIKFIFTGNDSRLIKIIPVGYGLPSEEGWSQIEQGLIYPGGDVLNGPLNPKYVVMIRI